VQSDAPTIACGAEGCFVAWHGQGGAGGAYASLIDPVKGNAIWTKRVGGTRPSLGMNDGQVAVAYYEGGRVRMAVLTRDGVGPESVLAKVKGDQPRPSLAPGSKRGEWLIAWQDLESGHSEAFAMRVACK
jgi:serine/threonine-protein kinase